MSGEQFYVVEFKHERGWTPCDTPQFQENEAYAHMRRWRQRLPGWDYRVVKYQRTADNETEGERNGR